MPELPEVESTVRYLRERLQGHMITSLYVGWSGSVDRPGIRKFKELLSGAQVVDVSRRAKFIVMHVSHPKFAEKLQYLLTHLRMSGSYDVVNGDKLRSKHDHVIFTFDDGRELRFHDPRKFGRLYLVSDMTEITSKLGPEPLSEEFTATVLQTRVGSVRRRIKTALLDQSILAGLGNIYVDEALWRSKIHPMTPSHRISDSRFGVLHHSIRSILTEAIDASGTDFHDGVVEGGMYRPQAYGRTGDPCERCGVKIRRIVVGQRGTHFCPRCQTKSA